MMIMPAPLFFAAPVCALEHPNPVVEGIQHLISAPELEGIEMGLMVFSLKRNEVVFARDADKLLKPASNVKLLTTLAALKYLGPDYTFKTRFYVDGPVQNGILNGNLYVKGFGDPKLVSEQLWFIANTLKRAGFRRVLGRLVIDDTYFDEIRQIKNGAKNRGGRAYDALLGALSVNFNTTAIYVKPAQKAGLMPRVTVDPDNSYIRVSNKAVTVASGQPMSLKVFRVPGKYDDAIVIEGNIPMHMTERRYYRNISYPRQYAAALLRRFLKERGIIIKGGNQYRKAPPEVREILVYESRPLRTIVSDLNRMSNNFVAEQILKTMAAELKGSPGTTDKGLELLGNFLKEIGITNHYKLVNGSGLSPDNQMTAAQLTEILKYGYRNFNLFPEYVSSMGIVGVDGTVDFRLKNTVAQGRVRAKTGSLTGVATLSGYLNTLQNETLAFSFLMNDARRRNPLMQHVQDQILLKLCHME